MKVIIASDSHKNRENILNIVKYAKDNNITTIFDAGDLHGCIDAYKGIENLHAIYFSHAHGVMPEGEFKKNLESIGGIFHENGSTFRFEDSLIYMKHNLAGYKQRIPEKNLKIAYEKLENLAQNYKDDKLVKYVFFGHTHIPHYHRYENLIAINPGSLKSGNFVILDLKSGDVEYRDFENMILRIKNKNNTINALSIYEKINGEYFVKYFN